MQFIENFNSTSSVHFNFEGHPEFCDVSVDAGSVVIEKTHKGWDTAGAIMKETVLLQPGMVFKTVVTFDTLTVGGDPESDDEQTFTILGLDINDQGPVLEAAQWGLYVIGGHLQVASSDNLISEGALSFIPTVGKQYKLRQEVMENGYLKCEAYGYGAPGIMGYVTQDLRGLAAKFQYNQYFTDTLRLHKFEFHD